MKYHLFYTYILRYFLNVTQIPKYVAVVLMFFPMTSLLQTSTEILEFNRERFFPLKLRLDFCDFY